MQSKDSTSGDLFAHYPPLVGVRLNIAVSATGQVAGASGSSNDVSNSLDRLLLVELRRLSDVIVTTGITARAERIRRSKHAPIVILTHSSSLEGYSIDLLQHQTDNQGLFFFTSVPQAPDLVAALAAYDSDAAVVSLDDLNPLDVVAKLRELGFKKLLLEFGPTTATSWFRKQAIDEVCLTITGLGNGIQENDANLLPQWFREGPSLKTVSSFVSVEHGSAFQRIAITG